MRKSVRGTWLAGAAAALISLESVLPAVAHHGWSWTEEKTSRIEGTIRNIDMGNPHVTLDVDVNGDIWRVELAPPSATIRAGFNAESAKVGDNVTAIGNRSRDKSENRMKAVRIIVNGRTYDVYPDRVPPV